MVLETGLYDELNVSPDATSEQIRTAYRQLALQHHPDKNPGVADCKRITAINYAYEILMDSTTRTIYDNEGQAGFNTIQHQFTHAEYATEVCLEDLFGDSVNQAIYVTRLCNSCEGKNSHCGDCYGEQLQTEFDVNKGLVTDVYTGVELVKQFQLYGDRYKPTILTLRLVETPHTVFKRDGHNLITRLSISLSESLIQLNEVIRTPDNQFLHIRKMPGQTTRDKEKFTLEGYGIPYFENGLEKRGDLIVFCRVRSPPEFYNNTPQLMLQALPEPPPTPDVGDLETVQIEYLQQVDFDSVEDLLDPLTADELEYNRYFGRY